MPKQDLGHSSSRINLSEMDTAGEGEGGMNSKRSTETNTLPHVKQTAVESCYVTPGAQPGAL